MIGGMTAIASAMAIGVVLGMGVLLISMAIVSKRRERHEQREWEKRHGLTKEDQTDEEGPH